MRKLLVVALVLASSNVAAQLLPAAPPAVIVAGLEMDKASSQGPLAPDFTVTKLDGTAVTLSKLRGKVVLLEFFATWCPACTSFIPELSRLHGKFAGQGVEILTVSAEDSAAQLKDYVAKHKIPYTVARDADASAARSYGITAYPTLFLIGKDGRFFIGKGKMTLDQAIEQALK